ncbi:hypothetical protein PVIIG_06068 [Plasmodium vivax India VII]|uniref:VIR protein n=2 Tax=Plasmodium vivax TaxID=5855 RepID=A0A1G4ED60_PLAVI|nr:hypothetical protein PVIIG_06068 [Plasmodium vivax India VII]SCA60415.1 hypothetical protein PVT01_000105900 [Plasmodium vivax]
MMFEKELKELIDYSTFKSYKKNKTTDAEIDNWIERFQEKLGSYSTDSFEDSYVNHDKRCKHFNYLINTTISELHSLSDDMIKRLEWSDKIKKCRDKFLLSNKKLSCKQSSTYRNIQYKDLGTFCEDSAFIKRRISDIENSVYCSNIANNMSSRKSVFINEHRHKFIRGGVFLNVDNECSIKFLDTIFQPITCNSSVELQSHVETPVLSDKHEDDQLEENFVIQQTLGGASFTADEQGLVTTSEEIEPSDGQSSNTLNTVALPIFGVLGCSFLFYKVSLMN